MASAGFKITAGGGTEELAKWNLNSLKVMNLKRLTDTHLTSGSQVLNATQTKGIFNHAALNGGMVDINTHNLVDSSPGAGDMYHSDIVTMLGYINQIKDGFFVIGNLKEAYAYMDANGTNNKPTDGNLVRYGLSGKFTVSDYHLLSTSPAIDAGTDVGLTTDYAGNPIYGAPDIGGYEYQPPYTMGTDGIPTTADTRTYGDEKFRNKTATTSDVTADLSVTIPDADKTQWLDIGISTWDNTGLYHKAWNASTTASGLTNTVYVVGDL
jgi:hypothetical protein